MAVQCVWMSVTSGQVPYTSCFQAASGALRVGETSGPNQQTQAAAVSKCNSCKRYSPISEMAFVFEFMNFFLSFTTWNTLEVMWAYTIITHANTVDLQHQAAHPKLVAQTKGLWWCLNRQGKKSINRVQSIKDHEIIRLLKPMVPGISYWECNSKTPWPAHRQKTRP